MAFFFRYLANAEAWASISSVSLGAWDEQIVDFSITHAEAAFATARLQVQARESSYHALGRYAVISVQLVEGGPIKPLLRGVITAIPRGLNDELVEMEMLARPDDWQAQELALVQTLDVAPWFDPLLVDADDALAPEHVLQGRAAVLAWDRITGVPRVSYIDSGPRTVALGTVVYEGMSIEPDQPPLSSMTIELTATWQQDASIMSDVNWNFGSRLEVMANEAALDAWPQPGADLGGNWRVDSSDLRFAKPYHVELGKVPGGYDSAIYSGTLPIFRATSAYVALVNDRRQARSETVRITVTAPIQKLMSTTTETETLALRRVIGSGDDVEPWQPTVSYSVGDVVFYNGSLYECVRAHTATYEFPDAWHPHSTTPETWVALEDSAGKIGESFFATTRGAQVINAAIKRAIARLRYAARAAKIRFEVPFADALDLRPDDMVSIADHRLPGGAVTGKLVSLTMNVTEDGGRWAELEIACSVGQGGSRVPSTTTLSGPAAPKLGPSDYPATGTVTPLANAQLAELRETPDLQTLDVRVEIDAPAVPVTYELSRSLTVAAGVLDLPKGLDL